MLSSSESRNAALICKSSVGTGARGLGKLIYLMKTPASTENRGKDPVDSSDDNGDFTRNPAYFDSAVFSAETPTCAHGRGADGAAVCGRIPK